DGEIHDTLTVQGIGASSNTTVFVGVCVRDLGLWDQADQTFGVGCTVATPCEELILDLLTPEAAGVAKPQVGAVGVINDPMRAVARRDDSDCRMPGPEDGHYM